MISITPLTRISLSHCAPYIAVGESGHLAAISKEGAGSILTPDYTQCTPFRAPADASDLSISPNGGLLAIAVRARVVLLPTSTLRPVHQFEDAVESCHFCATGELWTASRWDDDSIALEIREPETWQVVARTELTDSFGDSCFKILPHPDREQVAIWAAAGQDGQCLFWARRDGSTIAVDRFGDLNATTMPGFNRSGDHFLVVDGDNELRLYGFPQGPLLGKMRWPFDDRNNQIGEIVAFVDSARALLMSAEGRLYLVDLRIMQIADEISIEGHEPKSISEIYPGLRDPSGLCSDLGNVVLLPSGHILSVHRQLRVPSDEECGDSILTWRIP